MLSSAFNLESCIHPSHNVGNSCKLVVIRVHRITSDMKASLPSPLEKSSTVGLPSLSLFCMVVQARGVLATGASPLDWSHQNARHWFWSAHAWHFTFLLPCFCWWWCKQEEPKCFGSQLSTLPRTEQLCMSPKRNSQVSGKEAYPTKSPLLLFSSCVHKD